MRCDQTSSRIVRLATVLINDGGSCWCSPEGKEMLTGTLAWFEKILRSSLQTPGDRQRFRARMLVSYCPAKRS